MNRTAARALRALVPTSIVGIVYGLVWLIVHRVWWPLICLAKGVYFVLLGAVSIICVAMAAAFLRDLGIWIWTGRWDS